LEYTNLVDRYFAHMRERNPDGLAIFLRTMQRSSYRCRELSGLAAIHEM